MLTFKRFASSGAARSTLDEFFNYHATNAALKPWIYRPKNANILLTMDLKDPVTRTPLQPRKPVAPIPQKALYDYIASLEPRSTDLIDWFRNWTSISARKKAVYNYISAAHIQNMLINSFFRLGSYHKLVGLLYSRRDKFIEARNQEAFDVEHFFNTILMCSLQRNALKNFKDSNVAEKKLRTAWKKVSNKENKTGLANVLIATLARQQNFEVPSNLRDLSEKEVDLMTPPDVELSSDGKLANFLFANNNTYLIARTIAEFNDESSVDPKIKHFISSYQNISQKLGKDDLYDMYKASMENLMNGEQSKLEEGSQTETKS